MSSDDHELFETLEPTLLARHRKPKAQGMKAMTMFSTHLMIVAGVPGALATPTLAGMASTHVANSRRPGSSAMGSDSNKTQIAERTAERELLAWGVVA